MSIDVSDDLDEDDDLSDADVSADPVGGTQLSLSLSLSCHSLDHGLILHF